MKAQSLKKSVFAAIVLLLFLTGGTLIALVTAGPAAGKLAVSAPAMPPLADGPLQGDEELAYLLVKLELRTRGVIAGHYARNQSSFPGVNLLYKQSLTRNMILPAAVADRIFAEVVPNATAGRAWVKMVVDEPRNPNNRGDHVAKELLAEIKEGATSARRDTGQALYYAEPIKTNALCLHCHGEPAGAPDPTFPQFKKNGWKAGQVVGAVIARVGRRTQP
jgi:hypothetical protein